MSDPTSTDLLKSGAPRKFSWMPTLDGYIMRSFLVPFFILLFAFTLLFIIMDMYNDVGDFLDNKATLSTTVRYFLLKIPGNIRFILPITVLLACMYALANLGRNRELTAIRASGVSLVRCGLPIFAVGFCVMLVNYYFNEQLVPQTTRDAEILRDTVNNENFVEESNARLQFHSGDRLRSWYFGQFDDNGYQTNVKLKMFEKKNGLKKHLPEFIQNYNLISEGTIILRHVIVAEKTYYDEKTSSWMFFKPVIGVIQCSYKIKGKDGIEIVNSKVPYAISIESYAKNYDLKIDTQFSDFQKIRPGGKNIVTLNEKDAAEWLVKKYSTWPEDEKNLVKVLTYFAKTMKKKNEKQSFTLPEHIPFDEAERRTMLEKAIKTFADGRIDNLVTSIEIEDVLHKLQGKLDLSQNNLDILVYYDNEAKDASKEIDTQVYNIKEEENKKDRKKNNPFMETEVNDHQTDQLIWEKDKAPVLMIVSEKVIPDKPSVIIKSVIEPDALSSLDIITILRENSSMADNLRRIYWTIFFNRIAFPWACFLCAFFAFPLATKNERSGIFTAIATAVGIAVLYQVLNEVFMVAGKSGYLSFDLITKLLHFDPGPIIAGLTPTVVFGAYGIYLLKKSG